MADAWRTVRVFISSTFRDMQAERDHLVRFVFPRLREELLKRRIHFVDVDLRWGVTGDQDAFDLCMHEIEQCMPRFLCMLGGRYGWVPPPKSLEGGFVDRMLRDQTPAGVLEPAERALFTDDASGTSDSVSAVYGPDPSGSRWTLVGAPGDPERAAAWDGRCNLAVQVLRRAGHPETVRSITAAEVEHGALERLDWATFRYFYFRDPLVTDSIPEPFSSSYREPEGSWAARALADLKARIKSAEGLVQVEPGRVDTARLPVFEYPCRWDRSTSRIVDLQAFGERVYADLLASVEAEFGRGAPEALGRLAEERAALERFVEDRLERYVLGARRPILEALLEHARGSGGSGYLCLTGGPGSGKSALFGRLQRELLAGRSDPDDTGPILVSHFIGVNSTDLRGLLWRICSELAAGGGLPDEIPTDMEGLKKAFPGVLGKASESRGVVLILDALNQLDSAHGAHYLTWLPEPLPEGARVVLSTLPGPVLATLRRRVKNLGKMDLPPLAGEDSGAIVDQFLRRFRKSLDTNQREALLAKEDAGIPLYLLTALEELRTLGIYEEVSHRIRELPGKIRPLLNWILERLENDPGFRDPMGRPVGRDLVDRYCSYLSLGRTGMAQSELATLVAPADEAGEMEVDAEGNAAALRALLRPYLMLRGGLLDFFHGQFREAVEERFMTDADKRTGYHRDIASYFRSQLDPLGDGSCSGESLRALSELPYHLTEAEEWDELTGILTNFRFLERKVAEVGVVESKTPERVTTKAYTGVYLLQDDFSHALERMPGGGASGRGDQRPIILTPVDFGEGYVIRCPFCNDLVPFQEGWLGQEMPCPKEGCGGPWKVNPFKAVRPSWAGG